MNPKFQISSHGLGRQTREQELVPEQFDDLPDRGKVDQSVRLAEKKLEKQDKIFLVSDQHLLR